MSDWDRITPAQLEAKRERDRRKKRAKRARFYAAGLDCNGRKNPNVRPGTRGRGHGGNCRCYDCLFPSDEKSEYQPVVFRAVEFRRNA